MAVLMVTGHQFTAIRELFKITTTMSSDDVTNGLEKVKLPGFGLPVNNLPESPLIRNRDVSKRLCFPNAITSWRASCITVHWDRKVNDEAIVSKWRSEALGQESADVSQAMFDYCIAELRDKAPHHAQTGRSIVLDSEAAIVKSDTAIPPFLADELKAAVKPLEDVPEHLKDWHPGSNKKVLDLVHPSLYPLMYGKSRIMTSGRCTLTDCLSRCGEVVIVPTPIQEHLGQVTSRGTTRDNASNYWSGSYQWLPCEVAFRGEDQVEITSHINNLHPRRHMALYGALEKIIARTIPLWDDCLSYFGFDSARQRVSTEGKGAQYEYPLGKERPLDPDEDPEGHDRWDRDYEWVRANRVLIQPEPGDYEPYDQEVLRHVNLRKDWGEQGLQIIVKLANIELRPEEGRISYEGGTWHVEGQLNEHICASATYYYDQENVTESRLVFRELTNGGVEFEEYYNQDDYEGLEELYGIEQGGPCLQELGSTRGPSKPGHRKTLALFLVDPYLRTPSTANVAPRQRDWWVEVVRRDQSTRLGKLPAKLMDHVTGAMASTDWPLSLEEAKKVREDSMAQRTVYTDKVNRDYEQEGFSFCEH
ncbi:hypothetical protein AAF712_003187 [Marasmius tenuissimus]|uniref:DUF4246 domain-containing protein n=1 Tax=Marasmius tenuissimus TaxID=585030 RepID=A0ABR3A839_9AGAR